jgi:hypothetical protein
VAAHFQQHEGRVVVARVRSCNGDSVLSEILAERMPEKREREEDDLLSDENQESHWLGTGLTTQLNLIEQDLALPTGCCASEARGKRSRGQVERDMDGFPISQPVR